MRNDLDTSNSEYRAYRLRNSCGLFTCTLALFAFCSIFGSMPEAVGRQSESLSQAHPNETVLLVRSWSDLRVTIYGLGLAKPWRGIAEWSNGRRTVFDVAMAISRLADAHLLDGNRLLLQ